MFRLINRTEGTYLGCSQQEAWRLFGQLSSGSVETNVLKDIPHYFEMCCTGLFECFEEFWCDCHLTGVLCKIRLFNNKLNSDSEITSHSAGAEKRAFK